ncbi:MAG TPA: hypothetical protein VFA98_02000, partial [Thermoanaerobaculia bacterium]|nr:hypothetical protein [Thermoanaerobaculia bacterium]
AGLEVGTALVLLASPSLFARLLFGSSLASPGPGLGRLGGFALLALVFACWPTHDGATRPAAHGMLLFSVLCAVYLMYRGIRGGATGPLLWPAAFLHAGLAVLLARASRRQRDPSGAPS